MSCLIGPGKDDWKPLIWSQAYWFRDGSLWQAEEEERKSVSHQLMWLRNNMGLKAPHLDLSLWLEMAMGEVNKGQGRCD